MTLRERLLLAAGIMTDEEGGGLYLVTERQRRELAALGIPDFPNEIAVPPTFFVDEILDFDRANLTEAQEDERLVLQHESGFEAMVARTRMRWLESLKEMLRPGGTVRASIGEFQVHDALRQAVDAELASA